MKRRKGKSLYQALRRKIEAQVRGRSFAEEIYMGRIIRRLREERGLSGARLCERALDLDPRTLTALEKGRIKNPSIHTLQSLARGFGVPVSDLFRRGEMEIDRYFQLGNQKGAYQIDFPKWGVKVVSFTPFIRDFFCGKFIFGPKKKLDETLLKHPLPLYVSSLVGRFDVIMEDKKFALREGDNLFFNGALRHTFMNALQRESVLLVMTAPSFV